MFLSPSNLSAILACYGVFDLQEVMSEGSQEILQNGSMHTSPFRQYNFFNMGQHPRISHKLSVMEVSECF